ncbi:MAG: DUF177 domain-containing protein [Blastomonas sp.]
MSGAGNKSAEQTMSAVIDTRALPKAELSLAATPEEAGALAERFQISAIDRFEAVATLTQQDDAVMATGRLEADIVQQCRISGEDFPVAVRARFALRFLSEAAYAAYEQGDGEEEGTEISAEDCDTLAYSGSQIMLGEAIAQSLALEIDPYAEGPDADRIRSEYGLNAPAPDGPFAALASLRKE